MTRSRRKTRGEPGPRGSRFLLGSVHSWKHVGCPRTPVSPMSNDINVRVFSPRLAFAGVPKHPAWPNCCAQWATATTSSFPLPVVIPPSQMSDMGDIKPGNEDRGGVDGQHDRHEGDSMSRDFHGTALQDRGYCMRPRCPRGRRSLRSEVRRRRSRQSMSCVLPYRGPAPSQ